MIASSSFVHPPEDDDSEDDSEGDETFGRNTPALDPPHRMLQTSPALSSVRKHRSKVLTPMNSKNEDNTPRTTPRQIPHKSQATSPARGENIDPKQEQGSGGKSLPSKLVARKPDCASGDEEEAIVDKAVPKPSDPAGENDGATQSMNFELGTPFGDAYEQSLDTLQADGRAGPSGRAAAQKWFNSPTRASNLSASPPSPPQSSSPQQDHPQLSRIGDKLRLIPGAPHLRHLNWLGSDSIDDADDESIEIPVGHSLRLKKAQAQTIVDETAFLGGDEASIFARDTSMNNERLGIFRREGSASEGESGLAAMSEEHIPTSPLRPILSGSTRVASGSDVGTVRRSTGDTQKSQSTYDGTRENGARDNSQHLVSFSGLVKSDKQQPTPDGDHQSGPVGQSLVPNTAVVEELGSDSIITPISSRIMSLMETGSFAGFLPRGTPKPDPGFRSGETIPQYFTRALNSTGRTTRPASFSGLNSEQSFASDAIIRPKTSPGDLQENSTAAALGASLRNVLQESPGGDIDAFTEINPRDSLYSEGFVAQSTPKNYYGEYDIWAIKKSGKGRRVSMNTPPSTLERSLSGSEILNNPPEFSSLGSGFSFPSQPLRYQDWNPESVAREFTPPFPVEGVNGVKRMGLRLQGVDAPHNTPTPAVGKGSGPPIGWEMGKGMKEGKGRARSKSDPLENKVVRSVEKGLFTPGRVEKKKKEELEYDSEEEKEEEERYGDNQSLDPSSRPRGAIPGVQEKSIFSDESESPVGDGAEEGAEIHNGVDDGDDLDLRFVIFSLIF